VEPLNNHIILSHIDKPMRILFWPANQFFACTVPLAVGMTSDHMVVGVLLSLLITIGFRIFNRQFGRGKFRSIVYWYFPTPSRITKMGVPPSHVRYWIK
jgi:type IV conjugative transfer system protein TraL